MQQLTDESLKENIADGVTVIDFFADWCAPCRMLAPTFEKVAAQFQDKAAFFKVDCESSPLSTAQFKVDSLPTIIVFKDGQVVERKKGMMSGKQLEDLLTKYL